MTNPLFKAGRFPYVLSLLTMLMMVGCGPHGSSTALIESGQPDTASHIEQEKAEPAESTESTEKSDDPAETHVDSTQATPAAEYTSEIDESDAYAQFDQSYANAHDSSDRILSAAEAGEESEPLLDDGLSAAAAGEEFALEPEGYEAEIEGRIDDDGNVLPLVVNGLEIGMDYAAARNLILAEGWAPHELHPERNPDNPSVRAYHDKGYTEAIECAGNSLCSVSFVEREGYKFGLTTFGEPPVLRSWGHIYQ